MTRATRWVLAVATIGMATGASSCGEGPLEDEGPAATEATVSEDVEQISSDLSAGECRFSSATPRGTVTLVPTDSTQVGYDFSARTFQSYSGGDLYAYEGQFWANNLGQRGVVSLGACSSFREPEPPLTGYTRFGVPIVAGNCYAALTHNDERGYVVFRVERNATSGVDLAYVLVGATNQGVTLSATDSAKAGYDFSAATYKSYSGGDLYFYQGQFWANNLGQRGVVSVGACTSVTGVTTMPTSGYTRQGVTATAGQCYVSLTHNDERNHIVFRVDSIDASNAVLSYRIVYSGFDGVTLSGTNSAQAGYDFSARTFQSYSGGDLYFYQGQFWANNLGQRGVVSVGACSSPAGITPPATGYTRQGVAATAGQCYVSLTHNDERNHIVFRVDAIDGSNAILSYRIVSSGNSGVTLSGTDSTKAGYDFSARTFQGYSGGDLYFYQGQFWANNLGQRGVVSVGTCSSPAGITPPTSGYTRQGVAAVAGQCYVSLTHNDERNHIVFRVEALDGSNAILSYRIVSSGNDGVTLSGTDSTKAGYDFSAQTFQSYSGGDFYFYQGQLWANNLGQRGVVGVGACTSPAGITPPTSGYTRQGVTATAGQCYVSLTHNDERNHVVFRVETVSSSGAVLTYRIVSSGLGGVALSGTNSAQAGYDFSARTFQSYSGGDFYFYQGQFWANNLGQRGVVSVGACSSPAGITAPTSGYTRQGVTATAGQCYVSLSHNDERNPIVFRVESLTSSAATLTYRIVSTGNAGATLSGTDSTKAGFDFSARTYHSYSGGDFYFYQGQFWANNLGQRGVVSVGACSAPANITPPTSGYTRQGVTATAGGCYAALTHNDERDYIVFRVETVDSSNASIAFRIVSTGYGGVTLNGTDSTKVGYDFSARTFQSYSGGDFYFYQGQFWANNIGQRGVIGVGACSTPASVTPPTSGYTRQGVSATAGQCYVSLTHNDERSYLVFRVEELVSSTAVLTYRFVSTGTSGVTLNQAVDASRGYNFATRAYKTVSGGDFYYYQGQFWANNISQRGVVGMGACTSPVGLAAPTTGYTRQGVAATVGQCYAAKSMTPTCEVIIFRVSGVSGDTIALDWVSLPEP